MTGRSTRLDELDLPTDASLDGDGSILISGIAYDSRHATPGDLFVCLVGGYADGHAFAERAVTAGASALLVERPIAAPVPQIVVPDSRAALATVASADRVSGTTICGTGAAMGRSTSSAAAPAVTARSAKAWPSAYPPTRQTKRSPGAT